MPRVTQVHLGAISMFGAISTFGEAFSMYRGISKTRGNPKGHHIIMSHVRMFCCILYVMIIRHLGGSACSELP